jgi:hypothetical protein
MPISRPQSQLSHYSDRYRPISTPRTPSGSRRLTFGRPQSRQSDDLEDEGDVTITLDTANITPRRQHRQSQQHHRTISTASRPESRISVRSIQDEDGRTTPFKRPESATGRRISGIPTPSERRTSGIPPPSIRRQSTRPESPTRSTSSSSFHSDTHSVTPSTSISSMPAPTGIPRRQSAAHSALPLPSKSGIPMIGRKSGTGLPMPR